MASKFFKKTFNSMNEEDKEKWNEKMTKKLHKKRKEIVGIAAGEKETSFLNALLKHKVRKELLEEE